MRTMRASAACLWLASMGCRTVIERAAPPDDPPLPSSTDATSGAGSTSSVGTGGAGAASASSSASGLGPDEILASGLRQPMHLAVVGDQLYVTEQGLGASDGSLVRVPTSGGSFTRVVTDQKRPWAIEATADAIVWSNYGSNGDSEIRRLSLVDGAVETMASNLHEVGSLSASGDSIGFIDQEPQAVLALRPDSTIATLSADQSFLSLVVGDATAVYFGAIPFESETGLGALRKRSQDGTIVDLYPDLGPIQALTRAGSTLYFVPDGSPILRGSVDGAPLATLGEGVGLVDGLAVDGMHIYCSDLTHSTVERIPLDGGPIETVASDQLLPMGIVVDDQAVYWVDFNGGEVHRVAK